MNEQNNAGFIDGIENVWTTAFTRRQITTPTEIQRLVIPRVLQNEDVLFRSATGTGKTFAYLLPVIHHVYAQNAAGFKCGALILAPTVELSVQIKNETDFILRNANRGLSSILLIGGANIQRQKTEIKLVKPDIIIGTAQRITELAAARKLKLSAIGYLVLDEADRLVSNELLESSQTLVSLLPKKRVCIACSATISDKTKRKLDLLAGTAFSFIETDAHEILRSFISHWAVWCESRERSDMIFSLLAVLRAKRVLIFASSVDEITHLTSRLQARKVKARPLYSGQQRQERKAALAGFRDGSVSVLIATDLAARGLDISNIAYVITAGVHESSEIYIHRAGRTARGGKNGVCISVGDETDLRRLKAIEQKLKIIVYPKELYDGELRAPE